MILPCLSVLAVRISRNSLQSSLYFILLIGLCLQFSGCATQPGKLGFSGHISQGIPDANGKKRARILRTALSRLGDPYHFGGASPGGFDCSGLVYYSYAQAGIKTPRTTTALFGLTKPVKIDELLPGDLLFFRMNKRNVSHVGIYQGDGIFIHAPLRGKLVERSNINSSFWSAHLVRGGRLI